MCDKPMVTFMVMTYNQERFVRAAVRGALSQTYRPLEIVISDDHSTDKTWDIIVEEVEAYRKAGGAHHNIVLNRNEKNLGIAKHSDLMQGLAHGELKVGGGGDDVSEPNHVEEMVKTWLGDGKPMIICSGAWIIDVNGKRIGQLGEHCISHGIIGAACAYSVNFRDYFPPVSIEGAAEDIIYAERINILGGRRTCLRKNLFSYRLGSGVSSVVKEWRRPQLAAYLMGAQSYRQCLLDLSHRREALSQEQYSAFRKRFQQQIDDGLLHAQLLDSKNLSERWNAYRRIHYRPWFRPGGILQLLCLLPKGVGDPCLNLLARIYLRFNKKWMEFF